MEELAIDQGELASMVSDACLRYGRGREAPDPTFDPLTAMVLGVDDDELAAMVLDLCGEDVFVGQSEARVLPDLALRPGQASADDELDTWCADGFPESGSAPDPADKPRVDELVTGLVCGGELDLGRARAEIVSGWPSAYASVSARDDGTPSVSISERVSTGEETG